MIKDLVSVIIPTYNRASLIKRSIMSVLNQTYNNLELIIVDDGSTDNTEEIVKSIKDERIVYIKQPNKGACAARNNGIDYAKGEYIAFQDSDDVWHINKLERQLEALRKTEADIVFCVNVSYYNGKARVPNPIHKNGFIPKDMPPIWIGTQTFLGKNVIFKDNKFDEEVKRWQDFEFLVRIQTKYKLYFLREGLVDYYRQNDSITSKSQDKLLDAWNVILKKIPDIRSRYANNADLIARIIMAETQSVKDKNIKKQLNKLAYSFCNTIRSKCKYLFRHIYLKVILKPLKNTYHLFKQLWVP